MIEQAYNSKKRLIISILLALLIYSLLLLLLLVTQYWGHDHWPLLETQDQDIPITFANIPEEDPVVTKPMTEEVPEPAAMHSRASVFGATQEEQDIPEFLPGTTDSFSAQSIPESNDDPLIKESDIAQTEEQDAQEIQQVDEVSSQKDNPAESNTDTEQSTQAQITGQEDSASDGVKPAEVRTTLAEATETKKAKPISEQPPKKHRKKSIGPTRDNTGSGKKIASPIKKQITFADLAQGFIEQRGNDGQDWIDRKGNENIRPDLEDLKNTNYHMKLQWHVQNFLRVKTAPANKDWTHGLTAKCNISIDEQGFIKYIQIDKSSGNSDYDEWVINFFKTITPYPLPPKRLLNPYFNVQWSITLSEFQRIRYSY